MFCSKLPSICVQVLTIFQDLKVNKPLYYLVFGESLLNGIEIESKTVVLLIFDFSDAVVIVVHNLLVDFLESPIISSLQIIQGFNSFFITSLGGFAIGVIFGLGTAVITLHTEHSLGLL